MKKILFVIILITLNSCISNLSDSELITKYQKASEKKEWTDALLYINEGLKRKPDDTLLYFTKALCLKRQNPIKNYNEIIANLDIFSTNSKVSSPSLLLKYITYLENSKFHKAILTVNELENYYGISAASLELKANAQFLNKDYEQAAFNYEELLSYPQTKIKSEQFYYYKIYSKYFAGNKEGASWDTAFLPDYGFRENKHLLELIMNDKMNINNYNEMNVAYNFISFDEKIRPETSLNYEQGFIPSYIKRLFHAQRISVGDLNQLDRNIKILNLNNSKDKRLPDVIKEFKNLKALSLSKNNIIDFDLLFNQLSNLPKLEYLSLNYSNLKDFPSSIGKLKNLKGISIEASNIRQLPKEITELNQLSYLSVSNNGRLTDLPKEIRYLKNLNALDVSGSGMIRLRDELSQCYGLISIKANACKISSIPENIARLKLLENFNLGHNRLIELPKQIGYLPKLNHFLISSNELESLPISFSNLNDLSFLSLSFNRFKDFPDVLLELEQIQTLWVHNNNIPSIPKEIALSKNLTHLLVDHEIITQSNIQAIKSINPNLYVIQEDSRRYVNGIKRKS